MAITGVSAILLSQGLDRSFANLFSVEIDTTGTTATPTPLMTNISYLAEKINFGGDFSFETEYSEAMKQHFIKNAQRIKTVAITFRETSQYGVIKAIKDWMNKIYDPDKNIFKAGITLGTITVHVDTPLSSHQIDDHDDKPITLEGVLPTLLTYPAFDWSDGSPIKVNATFSFNNISWSL